MRIGEGQPHRATDNQGQQRPTIPENASRTRRHDDPEPLKWARCHSKGWRSVAGSRDDGGKWSRYVLQYGLTGFGVYRFVCTEQITRRDSKLLVCIQVQTGEVNGKEKKGKEMEN